MIVLPNARKKLLEPPSDQPPLTGLYLLPTLKELNDRFLYDPNTGDLTYRRAMAGVAVGSFAGKRSTYGYRIIINRCRHRAENVIYKMMTGDEPPEPIVFRDGDHYNLAWSNISPDSAMGP